MLLFWAAKADLPRQLLTLSSQNSTSTSFTLGYLLATYDKGLFYKPLLKIPGPISLNVRGNVLTPKNDRDSAFFPSISNDKSVTSIFLCNVKTGSCTVEATLSNIELYSLGYDAKDNQLWFVGRNTNGNNTVLTFSTGWIQLLASNSSSSPSIVYQFSGPEGSHPEGVLGPSQYYILIANQKTPNSSSTGIRIDRKTLNVSINSFAPSTPFTPLNLAYNAISLTNLTSLCASPSNSNLLDVQLCSPNFEDGKSILPLFRKVWSDVQAVTLSLLPS